MKHLTTKAGIIWWTVSIFILWPICASLYLVFESYAVSDDIFTLLSSPEYWIGCVLFWAMGVMALIGVNLINKGLKKAEVKSDES